MGEKDIAFLITTYNREESCQRLVDSLQGLGEVVVAHDGNDYSISGATNLNPKIHLGKEGYWRLVNMLYRNRPVCKYYLMIPDDFLIYKPQIVKAIKIWEGIKDPEKVCLNLFADRIGCRCWTNIYPEDKGRVWKTGWVDMCFLCEEKFFSNIGTIPDPHIGRRYGSSGVGAYISKILCRKGHGLYQVKESLVDPQEEHSDSMMHPKKISNR